MKHLQRLFLLICTLLFVQQNTFAQDLEDLLKGSLSDASLLVEGYVSPVMNGIGGGLNQGWYNTAKAHKTFGVDFTITTSLMYVPSSDKFYTVDNNKLQEIRLVSYDGQNVSPTGSGSVPTVFGPEKSPTYETISSGSTFQGPEGLDLKAQIKLADALPVPIYHLGLGLPKGTDLKFRWSPTLDFGDAKFSVFGIGVMHDVKQYIPGIKNLPFDLSGFVGYTKMKFEVDLSGATAGSNQKGVMEFNSTTIQGLISKKISVLTFYGGVGYNFVKSSIDIKGTYDLDDNGTPEATDPVSLNFKNPGFRATAGLRLKLAVFTFHGDYTLAKFNALSAGFGINIR